MMDIQNKTHMALSVSVQAAKDDLAKMADAAMSAIKERILKLEAEIDEHFKVAHEEGQKRLDEFVNGMLPKI
jgi:hypothetical protein